ncbi:MAG: phosphoribosylglycinamide formyltransferase [Rhodospirillaceae bacterium]|jgi:phosphoribosylglycinamide formyltransferase-1|nr:phosphoribosylglycinamide formyltransferase [Rhodospirillaceae bacterium]MBE25825.1 phosphoribosylglycinamide formyltransferase [Rhodospirillaceae bacterium]|tara:strand:- start:37 stop:711 length:675 start_codon:yes stop_codon:yes gene_type:complete
MNVAILISGRGSNMKNLVVASQSSNNNTQIVRVLSNRKGAPGIKIARDLGVVTETMENSTFENRNAFENRLTSVLEEAGAELICLAGFMHILGPDFVNHWHNRLINIHPSVLPAFKGLNTHQRVIEAGGRFSGCTVHFVRSGIDDGPIILQAITPVTTTDSVAALSERVLELEHQCYPLAVDWISKGLVSIVNERVVLEDASTHTNSLLTSPHWKHPVPGAAIK